MINNKLKILFFSTLFFFSNFYLSKASEFTGIDVNLQVGTCIINGICGAGEDIFNCPSDCTPVAPPVTKSSVIGNTIADNYFNNLKVEVSYNSAIIKWTSFLPVTSNLSWGTNPDYKDGVLRNSNYLLDHKIELDNLKDNTLYYFNIETENLLGRTNKIGSQIFRTLILPDNIPPNNLTNIKTKSDASGLTISWTNPADLDFDYVRVMRNENKNASPYNGKLVYEGRGNYFTDSKIKEGIKYFYSLFSRDRSGNYSSGEFIETIYNISNKDIIIPAPTQVEDLEREPDNIKTDIISSSEIEGKINYFYVLWFIPPILLILILLFLILRKK